LIHWQTIDEWMVGYTETNLASITDNWEEIGISLVIAKSAPVLRGAEAQPKDFIKNPKRHSMGPGMLRSA
jgi:hypothetical protein